MVMRDESHLCRNDTCREKRTRLLIILESVCGLGVMMPYAMHLLCESSLKREQHLTSQTHLHLDSSASLGPVTWRSSVMYMRECINVCAQEQGTMSSFLEPGQ